MASKPTLKHLMELKLGIQDPPHPKLREPWWEPERAMVYSLCANYVQRLKKTFTALMSIVAFAAKV